MDLIKYLCVFLSVWCLNFISIFGYHIKVNQAKSIRPHVCIIGAGIAGLTSARYLKDEGIHFTVLEATKYIGGTWRYDPRVGTDENGLPIHTSMYKHLRTNLPKPTMELRGFPVPEDMPSFPTWQIYYNYIKSYAKYFEIEKHIKFLHNVILVRREGNIWKVRHRHVITREEYEDEYDFVIVGTGHYSKPNMPKISGEQQFKGTIIHSHDYREPEVFKNRRVLIIGAGPSGMDIAIDVAYYCKTLFHSHHSKVNFRTNFPKHYIRKPDVKEFNGTGVFFVDGTYEEIDDVIYCTGYEYRYPFLDDTCGLTPGKHSVIPLYKHMVNINEPSMVLIGLIIRACLVVAIDAQARYATALIKGNFTLPSKEHMMEEWQKQADIIISKGRPLSDIHFLAEKEGGAVSRCSRKQQTVALSTAEAEYMAMSSAAQEALWLQQLQGELGGQRDSTLVIHSENISAIKLTINDCNLPRSKHIDIRHHFLRQHVNNLKLKFFM